MRTFRTLALFTALIGLLSLETAQIAPAQQPLLLSPEELASQPSAVSEDDEQIDRKAQADLLASIKDTAIVPYHPDPDLSKKVAPLQNKWNEVGCSYFKTPEGLPQSVTNYIVDWQMKKINNFTNKMQSVFPDARDYMIALNHLGRVSGRLFGQGNSNFAFCEKHRAEINTFVSIRQIIGCPSLEALESVESMRVHRGERDALAVAAQNRCRNFPVGQKASIEEMTGYNGYVVSRIRPEPKTGFDYWIAGKDVFEAANQ